MSEEKMIKDNGIVDVEYTDEMKSSYIDYAMSVICSRALPDIRDGLKPVQRRIMYAMGELGLTANKPHKKSARIVGDVLGKYHPHGDSSVYEAMVRLAQDFSVRYKLVDGHGNFGSIDGDGAAAMRYCVVGDTIVDTKELGQIRIDQIVEDTELNSDNPIDITIKSIDGYNKSDMLFNSGKHKTIKLIDNTGRSIEGSYNHPLYCFDKKEEKIVWVTLEDILPEKDRYLVAKANKENGYEIVFRKIKSVKKTNEEKVVYSIRVLSDCHSFVANDFINHNTEARMTKMGQSMLKDIHKNTIPFKPNFDESMEEPEVLPTLIPYSMLCGISGIAVGMATNMAPYNITSIYNALDHMIGSLLERSPIEEEELLKIVGLPDFPTGGVIVNYTEACEAVRTGKGRVIIRAKYDIVDKKNGTDIVITEIPYQVNKANLIKKINEQKEELPGIREVRDESTKDIRVVIELKKNAQINLVMNTLFKNTQLQSTFSINNTVLVKNEPAEVGMVRLLEEFLKHSLEVISNKAKYDLDIAEKEAHLKEGTIIALNNIDDVIAVIKDSEDNKESSERLQKEFNLSERQAKSIIATQLGTLSRSSKSKIEEELKTLKEAMQLYTAIVSNEDIRLKVLREEYKNLNKELGDERRTTIDLNADPDIDIDDLIVDETLIITYTTEHLIKSMSEKEFTSQKRGGKGSKGANLSDEDIIESLYTLNSKDDLLFITNFGKCYKLKAYDIEKSTKNAKGRFIGNYLDLEEDEEVLRMIALNLEERKEDSLIMVTNEGMLKKIQVSDLGVRNARVITFREGDFLIDCYPIDEEHEKVMITSDKGMAIYIDTTNIRNVGRTAMGVKGITLDEGDNVNSLLIVNEDSYVLTISDKGLGKMTSIDEFNTQNRGGKGCRYYKITNKTGKIISSISVGLDEEVLVMTDQGISIRLETNGLSVSGRTTSGSKIIDVKDNDKVNSITSIVPDEDNEDEESGADE